MRGNTKVDTAQPPRGYSRQRPAGCPKGEPPESHQLATVAQGGPPPVWLWAKGNQSKTVGVDVPTSQEVCFHPNQGANTRDQSS